MKTGNQDLRCDLQTIFASSSEKPLSPDAFLNFARTAERVCSASKRVEKAQHVADYFDCLFESDLVRASRFLSGQIFPVHERRCLSVGPSTLITAIARLTKNDPESVRAKIILSGDIGLIAYELFDRLERPTISHKHLTLLNVYAALDEISCTYGTKHKTERVSDLLRQASPLEAKYLVKMIAGDLRIGLLEGTVEDAIARWTSTEISRIQRANMLLGDIGDTALLAHKGQLDTARISPFHPMKFMLATPIELSEGAKMVPEQFYVEDKFDGIRVQVHIGIDLPELRDAPGMIHEGIRVALFSRLLEDITASFSDLIPFLSNLLPVPAGAVAANGVILDGEIIPISQGRALPVSVLHKMVDTHQNNQVPSKAYAAFIAFDILCRDGKALIQEPLTTRSSALDDLCYDRNRTWRVHRRTYTDPNALSSELEVAQGRGSEGIVVKDPRALYRPGRRSSGWLKIKHAMATLDVVVTAAEVGPRRKAKHLSDYTFAVRSSREDPRLLEIGKTSIGLDEQDVAQLDDWFRTNTIQQYAQGRVRRVVPRIVLEVTFHKVRSSRRYESGYALELPRILRIRRDKPASEIDTLDTVRSFAEMAKDQSDSPDV